MQGAAPRAAASMQPDRWGTGARNMGHAHGPTYQQQQQLMQQAGSARGFSPAPAPVQAFSQSQPRMSPGPGSMIMNMMSPGTPGSHSLNFYYLTPNPPQFQDRDSSSGNLRQQQPGYSV